MTQLPEMTCKELVELVTDYLEGALSTADRSRFDEHIAGCPFCTTYLEQMRETIRAAGRLPEESIAPQALSELLARFREWR
jgi:anti-sigma factor RsiW